MHSPYQLARPVLWHRRRRPLSCWVVITVKTTVTIAEMDLDRETNDDYDEGADEDILDEAGAIGLRAGDVQRSHDHVKIIQSKIVMSLFH